FQAEDGIRDYKVTGVQTCALPISLRLVGTLNQDTWTLGLAANSPNDFSFGGFEINDVTTTIHANGNHFDGSFGGSIAVALCSNRSEERRVGKECSARWWACP